MRQLTTVDRFFEDFFKNPLFDYNTITPKTRNPNLNVRSNKNEYIVEAELPGIVKENLNVHVENGILTIKAERKTKKKVDDKKIYSEFKNTSTFSRSLSIGDDFDVDNISADLNNGVLTIKLPLAEKARPKVIDVKVGE